MRAWLRRVEWEAIAVWALALPLIVPFLAQGLPNTADAEIHLHRLLSAAVNLEAGYLYPRWTPYLHHGYGYPIHNFYAPGVHLIGAAIFLLTRLDAVIVWKGLQIGATLLYPLGAYGFVRTFASRRAAWVGAALYVWVPFRFDELWMQSNLSQFAAMALIPFLFWAIAQGATYAKWRHSGLIGLCLGLIVYWHHPTAFLTAPFAGGYALWLCGGEWRSSATPLYKRLLVTLGGLALGVAVSAAFWLPALAEFQYVQIQNVQQGQFNAAANLLPFDELTRPMLPLDQSLQNPPRAFAVGQVHFCLVLLSLAGLFTRLSWRTKLNLLSGAGLFALAMFLMTPASSWFWEHLPIARLVVYPWRLLGIAAFAALPAAALLDAIPARFRSLTAGGIIALIGVSVLPLLYVPQHFYSVTEFTPAEAYIYEKRTGNLGLTSGNEYLPIWVQERPLGGDPRNHTTFEWRVDLYAASLPAAVTAEREICAKGTTCYQLTTPEAFTLLFNQMYYVGWSVTLNGQAVTLRPQGVHGLIALDVPAGEHRLTIHYGGTPLQHGSEALSLIAALTILALCLSSLQERAASPTENTPDTASAYGLALGLALSLMGFTALHQFYLLPQTDFMRPTGDPAAPPAQVRLNEPFGDDLALVGYDLATTSVPQGGIVRIRLYWHLRQATAVSVRSVVQITDRFGGQVLAQADDTFSIANQNFATWQAGKYAIETHTLRIPTAAPPFLGQLRVVAFTQNPDLQYLSTASGAEHLSLTDFRIVGDQHLAEATAFTPQAVMFGDQIALEGLFWRTNAAGESCLVVRWQARQPPSAAYNVLLHFLDEGQFLSAADRAPFENRYPTNTWAVGQRLDDEYCLTIPPAADTLAIGFYDVTNPLPLPAQGSGSLQDNTLRVSLHQ
jgi:hypothetical protein